MNQGVPLRRAPLSANGQVRAYSLRFLGGDAMQESNSNSIRHDAAVAAAMVVLEEFFPHCPNGMAGAIHERLCEIIEVAMESANSARWQASSEPSKN